MNRKILLSLFLCVILIGITACGKGEDKNKEQSITREEATTAETQEQLTTEAPIQMPKDADGFYVVSDYVETVGDTINVRVEPSTSSSIYMLLESGKVLKRTGYNEEWTRVFIDNTNFYIFSDYVVETEAPEGVEEATPLDADGNEIQRVKKIVIDPGNQGIFNATVEAIGPNSEETKQGASFGNVGELYGTREYEINLKYAKLLRDELVSRGYEVILTREINEVDMTNKQRAEFANQSGATVFIRIQMNFSVNEELSGVMALTMTNESPYNSGLYSESNELATRILQGLTEETEATNRGIYETDQMTAINWSEIPVAVIKLGYLSNSLDEEKLNSEEYMTKVITGLANGIDYFFE